MCALSRSNRSGRALRDEIAVSAEGVTFPHTFTEPVDVLFDDERVWSFSPRRDGVSRDGVRMVPWPTALRPFLSGRAQVALRHHATGETYFDRPVGFGDVEGPVRVVDANGYPLAVDKTGRVQRTFSRTAEPVRGLIVDAVGRILRDLREECGLDAFLAYGCLLGAVRDGRMIDHDADADVSYVSRCTHPFDVIREAGGAIRRMRRLGWQVVRMSGADFKVWVDLGDGRRCGVDVFGSFYVDGVYHLAASLSGHLDPSVIFPLGTVTLEGRDLLAPRDVGAYLEFVYGPGWRVPDPSFRYTLDPATVRRMDGWLRASRRHLRHWQEFYRPGGGAAAVPRGPSQFARWVDGILEPGQRVVDAGTGTGRDALWLAGRGHRVLAVDYCPLTFPAIRRLALEQDLDVRTRKVNFNDTRSVLLTGARLAHYAERPHHIYARFLLDALDPDARALFWRFARMSQRRGGLTFLEFRTDRSRHEPTRFPPHPRAYLPPGRVVAEVAGLGGHVVRREVGRGLAVLGEEDPEVCRLVVRWES